MNGIYGITGGFVENNNYLYNDCDNQNGNGGVRLFHSNRVDAPIIIKQLNTKYNTKLMNYIFKEVVNNTKRETERIDSNINEKKYNSSLNDVIKSPQRLNT